MKANQVRAVIISRDDLVDLHAALVKIRTQALSAVESGVVAETTIKDLVMVEPIPRLTFDGTFYTQVLFVTTG